MSEYARLRQVAGIEDRQIVGEDDYTRSVRMRLEKIGKRASGVATEAAGRECLKGSGKILLLTHEHRYHPIPNAQLREVFSRLGVASEGLPDVADERGLFVVSMSVLHPDQRLVFWDVVWPHLKYKR